MIKLVSIILITALMAGCVNTSAVMLKSGESYAPTENVEILTQPPTRPYKEIAVIESRGPVNTPLPQLLENMKWKASKLGADAVIPTQDASTQQQQGVIYNPWLGGYQTIGGGTMPVIRGVAIKYTNLSR